MARSIQEIFDAIVAEKEAQGTLSGLLPANTSHADLLADITSNSKVAIWRLWAHVVAVACFVEESLWDAFKVELEAIAASAPAGTTRWYRDRILEFQFGDQLEYISNRYRYAVEDLTKRIVALCAVTERNDGLVLVKAAKLVNDVPTQLDAAEKTALEAYARLIKFAGVRLTVISEPADILRLVYDIHYDAQVPLATVQNDVAEAIDNHIENLPFDGILSITRLTDAIQAVSSVVDPFFISATGTEVGSTPESIVREYNSTAGYLTINDPVSTTFNWIPA